jgi:hypothetical protein
MHWTYRLDLSSVLDQRLLSEDHPMTGSNTLRLLTAAALATAGMLPVGPARADAVIDWNVIALNATAFPPNSILQSRALAIVHGAIYDAVHAVEYKGDAYAVDIEAPAGTSAEAAVVAAAHATLTRLAPGQRPMLDSALKASLAKLAGRKNRRANRNAARDRRR